MTLTSVIIAVGLLAGAAVITLVVALSVEQMVKRYQAPTPLDE